MGSKKRPLWLTWKNPDPMAEISVKDFGIIFKNGDGKRCTIVLKTQAGIFSFCCKKIHTHSKVRLYM